MARKKTGQEDILMIITDKNSHFSRIFVAKNTKKMPKYREIFQSIAVLFFVNWESFQSPKINEFRVGCNAFLGGSYMAFANNCNREVVVVVVYPR